MLADRARMADPSLRCGNRAEGRDPGDQLKSPALDSPNERGRRLRGRQIRAEVGSMATPCG
jgi:hypothetical protein